MYLAIKEIKRNRGRYLMIAIIFVLISWLVFILSGLGNGLQSLAAASFKNMKANAVVLESGARDSIGKSLLSADSLAVASAVPNVKAASPLGASMATAIRPGAGDDEEKQDIALLGIEAGGFLEPTVIEGEGLSSGKPDGAIVNVSLKDEGFRIGDTFKLDGSTRSLTIVGFVKGETYNHVASAFIPIEAWRAVAFAVPGADKGIRNPANAIMLQGESIDFDAVESAIPGSRAISLDAAIRGLPGYQEESSSITMMLSFLFVISAFMLGVFFYVFTLQKSNQFGVLKAIGARNGFLSKAVLSQVFVISVVSIVVGVALTYVSAAVIPRAMPFRLDRNLVIGYSIALLAIALLSSLVSVRSITNIDPLKALGRVE